MSDLYYYLLMMDKNKKFIKPENIFFRKNPAGTYVLANAEDDDLGIMELEDTAAEIWECIISGKNVGEVVETLAEEYDSDPDEIHKDVEEFINQLLEINYLTERS